MSDAREILDKVASGEMTPEEAETALKMKPFVDLGFAKPDLHRGLRQGIPEVIFGEGKTPEQIDKITGPYQRRFRMDCRVLQKYRR